MAVFVTLALVLTLALQMAVLYLPVLNEVFDTQPLAWDELMVCLLLSSAVFIGVEFEKWLVRRGWLYRQAQPG